MNVHGLHMELDLNNFVEHVKNLTVNFYFNSLSPLFYL